MPEQPSNSENFRRPWFEPITAILMAVASLSTAWCSYQNSLWSGHSHEHETKADKLEKEVFELRLRGQQIEATQLQAVMEVVDAVLEGDQKRADFYTARFTGELKAAYEKWIALRPFESPQSPPHPFVPTLYTPRHQQEVSDRVAQAAEAEVQSNIADHTASTYLSNTVILASVLFFAGTVGKFDQRHVRWSSLTFALVLFCYALVRIVMLPVA